MEYVKDKLCEVIGKNSWYHTIYKSYGYGVVYRFWTSFVSGVNIDLRFSLEGVEYEKEIPLCGSDDEGNWETIRPCEPLNYSDLWSAVKKEINLLSDEQKKDLCDCVNPNEGYWDFENYDNEYSE
ncbi:hypothetical protein [Helicobacter pylori]|uniref:hypothetical protein n=1 Tax=Helicobacter pylori TaxID=210 RepID=UPI000FDD5827|nr:hypothetical protein [Helicobacter pylori]RVZ32151.1 hypothetical protein EC538_02405 [Helicobacter pylori]